MNKRKEFIEPLSDSVKKAYKLMFKKFDDYEKEGNKCFEDFTVEDFNDFVKRKLIGKSANSTNVKVNLCKKYAEYIGSDCVQLGLDSVKNMVKDYLEEKKIEDENELKYVSMKDLSVAINRISNNIDVAIIYLLRYGISGNKFTELVNLKVEDINLKERLIKLEDRVVEIDEEMSIILEDAIQQDEYFVIKGGDKEEPKVEYYQLNMDCPYLIKQRPNAKNNYGMANYKFSGITGRIFRVMQELNLDISAINLLQSHATDKLMKHEEELGKKLSIKEAFDYLKSIGSKQSSYDIIAMARWVEEKYGNK